MLAAGQCTPPAARPPEHDVLGDRQTLYQAEVLVHHEHTLLEGVARRPKGNRLTVDFDVPAVRLIETRQEFAERCLPRAVLAHQPVDLTAPDVERDVFVGDHVGETLR